ncbi:Chloramphenicol 3-O phosphotransferase [Mycolicibacterium aubagnense]
MIARIVLLNGVGSAGKTSIAKALQTLTRTPFLHVQMDMFLEMMPETLQTHPDGVSYDAGSIDGKPAVAVGVGPIGARVLRGMRHAVAAMAAEGNDMIIDDVLFAEGMQEYRKLLSRFDLRCVGILAPLEVLERREAERGDRMIGLARWQFDHVHRGIAYDLKIDSSVSSPMACAAQIRAAFNM